MPELVRSGKVRVITVALQRPEETAAAPAAIQAAVQAPLVSPHGASEPRGLLAIFGNRVGALPYTVVLDAERRPCARQAGEFNRRWLENGLTACRPS